jgi:hypothetical protein
VVVAIFRSPSSLLFALIRFYCQADFVAGKEFGWAAMETAKSPTLSAMPHYSRSRHAFFRSCAEESNRKPARVPLK